MRYFLGIFFFLFFGLIGVGIIVSGGDLLQLCRRECAGNALIFALFGNTVGKIVAGTISIMLGLWALWFSWRGKPRRKDYYTD